MAGAPPAGPVPPAPPAPPVLPGVAAPAVPIQRTYVDFYNDDTHDLANGNYTNTMGIFRDIQLLVLQLASFLKTSVPAPFALVVPWPFCVPRWMMISYG